MGRQSGMGVKNAQAVAVIRTMQPGDIALIYHSGGETAIVGVAEITSEARPDPNEPKSWVVDVRYRGRVEPPVTLRQVKASWAVQRLRAGAAEPPLDHGRAAGVHRLAARGVRGDDSIGAVPLVAAQALARSP